MTSEIEGKHRRRSIIDFLRPHWKALALALLAVLGEAGADVLQPWPLKIVLDYLLQSKKPPAWLEAPLRLGRARKTCRPQLCGPGSRGYRHRRRDQFLPGKLSHHQRRPIGDA